MFIDLVHQVAASSINPTFYIWGMGIIYLTGLVLLIAVTFKFIEHSRNRQKLAEKFDHPISTKEMLICVLALFPFWVNSIGQLEMNSTMQDLYFCIGSVAIICGFFWHLWSKISISSMWSDGIEIKNEHQLVTTGAYVISRHPMYASLLLWCWGASLLMFNWITLLLVMVVLLPLMIKRAKDEELQLLKVKKDYVFYQQNVRMLTPTISGNAALTIKLIAIILLGYLIYTGITLPGILLLFVFHLYLGYSLKPEKVAFSYRSKSVMMVIIWSLSLLWPSVYYVLYMPLITFVYGLKFDCPCMLVYNKYKGCPCFALLNKFIKNNKML